MAKVGSYAQNQNCLYILHIIAIVSTYLVPDRHWMQYWSIESQYYAHLALNQYTVMSWNATLIHYPCLQCRVSLSLAVSATREDIITRHSSLTRWQKVSLSNLKPTQSVSSQSAPSQEDHLLNYWLWLSGCCCCCCGDHWQNN